MRILTVLFLLLTLPAHGQGLFLMEIGGSTSTDGGEFIPQIDTYSNEATRAFPAFKPTVWSTPGSFNSILDPHPLDGVAGSFEGFAYSRYWLGYLRRPIGNGLDKVNQYVYVFQQDSIPSRTPEGRGGSGIPSTGTELIIRHDQDTSIDAVGGHSNPLRIYQSGDNISVRYGDNEGPIGIGCDNWHGGGNSPTGFLGMLMAGNHTPLTVKVTQFTSDATYKTFKDFGSWWTDSLGHHWILARREFGATVWNLISNNVSVEHGIGVNLADSLIGTTLHYDKVNSEANGCPAYDTNAWHIANNGNIENGAMWGLNNVRKHYFYFNGKLYTTDSQYYVQNIYSAQECYTATFFNWWSAIDSARKYEPAGGYTYNPPLWRGKPLFKIHYIIDYQPGGGEVHYEGFEFLDTLRFQSNLGAMDQYNSDADVRDTFRVLIPSMLRVNDGAKDVDFRYGVGYKDTVFNAAYFVTASHYENGIAPTRRLHYISDTINGLPFFYNFNMGRVRTYDLDTPELRQYSAVELYPTEKHYQGSYSTSPDSPITKMHPGNQLRYVYFTGFAPRTNDGTVPHIRGWYPIADGKTNESAYVANDTLRYHADFQKTGTYHFIIPSGTTFHVDHKTSNVSISGSTITVSAISSPDTWLGIVRDGYAWLEGYLKPN